MTIKDSGEAPAAPQPLFASVEDWMVISGMSRRVVYEELGNENLKAVKHGRSTLIDVEHGLRYMRSLPPAKIRAPRRRGTEMVAA